jgi:hypothetical protein
MNKYQAIIGTAFVCFVLAVTATAQQSNVGGLAARLRLQSLGVGVAAPATGNITATGTVTANNYVGNVGGVASSDFARLSQANVFTSLQTLSNVGGTVLRFTDGNAPANEQTFEIVGADDGQFYIRTLTDALGAGATLFNVTRTGTTVDSINLAATAVQVNGSTVRSGAFQRVAYGTILESAGACSINNANTGIASASYAAVPGRCNLTLNAGFSAAPSCTATPVFAGPKLTQIECTTATACVVSQQSDFTTGVSGASGIICLGT